MIGDEIEIVVREVRRGSQVRIGIRAPEGINIAREEIYEPPEEKPASLRALLSEMDLYVELLPVGEQGSARALMQRIWASTGA